MKVKLKKIPKENILDKLTYRLSTTELNNALQVRINNIIKNFEKVIKKRIFNKGIDSQQLVIGKYSKKAFSVKSPNKETKYKWAKPEYADKYKFPLFLKQGYYEFREKQDLANNNVKLFYTGKLHNEYGVSNYRKRAISIGFTTTDSFNLGVKLSNMYGKAIFEPTRKESDGLSTVVLAAIDDMLLSIGNKNQEKHRQEKILNDLITRGYSE